MAGLRGVFLSFMGSIKVVVVVQSTWLSPVVSHNSFNQVPPCTIEGEDAPRVCLAAVPQNPVKIQASHWSGQGLWMHLSALLKQGQPG